MKIDTQPMVRHTTDRLARKYLKWVTRRFKGSSLPEAVVEAVSGAKTVIDKHKLDRDLKKKKREFRRGI